VIVAKLSLLRDQATPSRPLARCLSVPLKLHCVMRVSVCLSVRPSVRPHWWLIVRLSSIHRMASTTVVRHSSVSWRFCDFTPKTCIISLLITLPPVAELRSVCLLICPRPYLWNHSSEFHQIFCACHVCDKYYNCSFSVVAIHCVLPVWWLTWVAAVLRAHQTWNWVIGSPGHLGYFSRPGHRVIILTLCETRAFPVFEKKPKIKI